MTVIRPISDLRNHATEISELCHTENQPVFITKNGKGDLVVMSQTHYDRIQRTLDLYQKLGEAEILDATGDKGITHAQLMKKLKARTK
jgi:prevent-host-death family protein